MLHSGCYRRRPFLIGRSGEYAYPAPVSACSLCFFIQDAVGIGFFAPTVLKTEGGTALRGTRTLRPILPVAPVFIVGWRRGQRAGLITRRPQVRILPPQPSGCRSTGLTLISIALVSAGFVIRKPGPSDCRTALHTGCRSGGLLRMINRDGVRETPELPPLALPKVSLRLLRRFFIT